MTECLEDVMGTVGAEATDIQHVTYSNNGKSLNATLWFGNNFLANPIEYIPTYTLQLDVDPQNDNDVSNGADYMVQVRWDNVTFLLLGFVSTFFIFL
jgi:hypothetical protein